MAPNASDRALADVDADALSIPKAKDLAIFLRAGHDDGARLVNCWQSSDGSVEWLIIEVSVSVPQRPVNDIKPKEIIVVVFSSNEQTSTWHLLAKTRFSVRSTYESANSRRMAKSMPLRPTVVRGQIRLESSTFPGAHQFGGLKRPRTVRCTNLTSRWSLCYSIRIQT